MVKKYYQNNGLTLFHKCYTEIQNWPTYFLLRQNHAALLSLREHCTQKLIFLLKGDLQGASVQGEYSRQFQPSVWIAGEVALHHWYNRTVWQSCSGLMPRSPYPSKWMPLLCSHLFQWIQYPQTLFELFQKQNQIELNYSSAIQLYAGTNLKWVNLLI